MTKDAAEMSASSLGSAGGAQHGSFPFPPPESGGRKLFLFWTERWGWAWYEPDERGVMRLDLPPYTHHSVSCAEANAAVSRTERGWSEDHGSHPFMRNTLLSCDLWSAVIWTIGDGEDYETHAFKAAQGVRDWVANVNDRIPFTSSRSIDSLDEPARGPKMANEMHERVVSEVADMVERGILP